MDMTAAICRYEEGEMDDVEMIDFVQGLIDSGLVWVLQGSYRRLAAHYIEEGHCTA